MSILRSTLNRPTLYTTQVNVTGEFHNLTSSGTFPLPGNDTRSSGLSGAVQLSNGNGGFNNDGQLYVQDGLVLDNSVVTDQNQKPFVLALAQTQQPGGYVPNPGVDNDGDIFYGALSGGNPTSFWGYKGGWVDLAGGGGGGGGSANPPKNSIQFSGTGTAFVSSPLFAFYEPNDTTPSGITIPANANLLAIGSGYGQSGIPVPGNTALTTTLGYISDTGANPVEFALSQSGLNLVVPNGLGNQEVRIETGEIAPGGAAFPPVLIQTRDGNMNFQSLRQTNGSAYGEGSINLLTNSGGIILQSRGENSGGGTATGVNGGLINLDSQDGNILLHSTRKSANKSVELRSQGAFGNVTTDSGILLNSIQQASGAASVSSGKITLQTEGGSIDLSTTTGSQGLTNSGSINLSTAVGDIKLNAKGIARNIELTAEGSILARNRLEIQNTTNPITANTTVTIDGASGNITTTIGDITANTGDITATAGTITGNNLVSTLTTTVGTDLIVENDAIIGNTGGGSFTVKTANTTVGPLPALRTYSAAGVDQTKLNTSLSLMADTSAVLDINGANSRRLVAAGSLAYNSSARLLTYGGLNPAGNLSNKFIGNKVLLKSTEFIQSLSKNNSKPDLTTPLSYTSGVTGGYQSAAIAPSIAGRKNFDLTGNVVATNLSNDVLGAAPGGINDVFCLKVQMPPRYTPTGAGFQNEFSVLVEGTVAVHYFNDTGSTTAYANIGVGVWATDAPTPNGSARPAPYNEGFGAGVITTAADAWRWGGDNFNRTGPITGAAGQAGFSAGGFPNPNQGFVQSGGTDSWPRAMHASYYYNLNESQVPPTELLPKSGNAQTTGQDGFGLTTTQDFNDDSSAKGLPVLANPANDPGWIDPLGAPSTNNRAGDANCGSYYRCPLIDNGEYEIAQVPFSIVCQNTNNTSSVQTQYIWVTLFSNNQTGSGATSLGGPYIFREGYFGLISSNPGTSRYGGVNTCSVYYVGDPDVMSDTTDA